MFRRDELRKKRYWQIQRDWLAALGALDESKENADPMSQKKQKAQEKAKSEQRHYPTMTAQDLEARLNIAGAFAQLMQEELSVPREPRSWRTTSDPCVALT